MSDTFCPLPWIFQAVRNNGDIRVCCQANQGYDKGLVRKENGEIYNAGRDKVELSRNAPLMKQIRMDMLSNKWNPACKRCEKEKLAGLRNRRENEIDIWSNELSLNKAREITDDSGAIDSEKIPLKYYDVRLGNLCNLKCRSCGPTDSSAWYSDYVSLWGHQDYDESFGKVKLEKTKQGFKPKDNPYRWYEKETYWDGLKANIKNISHFQCVGGEPFLIKEQWEFLQFCVASGQSKNMIIEYNSNVTKIPEKAWSTWEKFKEVRIGASIDGFEKINDYIRYPSKWDKIVKNLESLDASPDNFNVWVTITIMAYNIYYLDDIIAYFLQKNFVKINKNPKSLLLTPHPLHGPPFQNIKVFPLDVKLQIEKKLLNSLDRLRELAIETKGEEQGEKYFNSCQNMITGYIDFMNQEDLSGNFQKFWKFTKNLDRIRQQNFQNTFPEFFEVLEPYIE